jgi:hypothetical protein
MSNLNVAGPWELVDFSISFSDGRKAIFPFGEDGEGLIIYSEILGTDEHNRPYGTMSAVLSRADRPKLSSSTMETAHNAGMEEKASAFDSYLHYAGTYHFEGDEIIHTVQFALDPNNVGNQQRRKFKYDTTTGLLTLSYHITAKSGVVRTYKLIWQRQQK